jgi:type IV pilus assembly protein PilA
MTKLVSKCKERLANARKNNKGFTLVELIVVIVILAILIGVTVGGVMTYVNQSRENTDINNAAAMESVLSTIATNEDIYKIVGKGTAGTYTLEWADAGSVPALTIGTAPKTVDVAALMNALVELPDSQTGDGFRLTMTSDGAGNVVVKCIALCESGASTTQTTPTTWDTP